MMNKSSSMCGLEVDVSVPKMDLKVLLVESDDSTRFIISALLRKCNYTVVAVSDGLKAWETLKDQSPNIDLILTEVELPAISGYALLTLIMEHDFCKNIPVIMMSSQDSIDVVLKCMSRGAADFLIKPLRRNELTNIWHHVWRRKSEKAGDPAPVIKVPCGNNAATTHSNDYLAPTQVAKEQCKKGCDDQSSSTASYLEAERAHTEIRQKISPLRRRSGSLSNKDKQEGLTKPGEKSLIPKSEDGVKQSTSIKSEVVSCIESYISPESKLEADLAYVRTLNMLDSHADEVLAPASAIDLISNFPNHPSDIRCSKTDGAVDQSSNAPFLELALGISYPVGLEDDGSIEPKMKEHSNDSAILRHDPQNISEPNFPSTSNAALSFRRENFAAIIPSGQVEAALPLNCQPTPYPVLYTETCISPVWQSKSAGDFQQPSIPTASSVQPKSEISHSEDGRQDEAAYFAKSFVQESSSPMDGLAEMGIHCPTQREAAVLKFRLKRKERCFDKKVRYEGRKRLAERRPRAKGQFVPRVQAKLIM